MIEKVVCASKAAMTRREGCESCDGCRGPDEEDPSWELPCSACGEDIRGFRYTCATCTNFDLCHSCEHSRAHAHHDMVRLCSPARLYPTHFFARLHRLYERAANAAGTNSAFASSCGCGGELFSPPSSSLDLHSSASPLDDEELLTVEELTRGIQDLAERDVSPAPARQRPAASLDHRLSQVLVDPCGTQLESLQQDASASGDEEECDEVRLVSGLAAREEEAVVPVETVVNLARELDVSDLEEEEALQETSAVEAAAVVVPDETETIRGLQEKIDRLLAPLAATSSDGEEEPKGDGEVGRLFSVSSGRSSSVDGESPFEVLESREVVRAIIEQEEDVFGGNKRELRLSGSSADEEEKRGRKVPRRAEEVRTEADFDTITVTEVVEMSQEEEGSEEEDGEQEEPRKTYKDEKPTGSCSPKEKEPSEDGKAEEAEQDPFERVELRRALHRAGLDPGLITNAASYKFDGVSKEPTTSEAKRAPAPPLSLSTVPLRPWTKYVDRYSYVPPPPPAPVVPTSPRVREALSQMLQMGFSDDDGWLTQLLNDKRGDIDQVLEILAPVDAARRS